MKTTKKIISLLICAIMLMSSFSICVLAEEQEISTNVSQSYSTDSDDYYFRYSFDEMNVGTSVDGKDLSKHQKNCCRQYERAKREEHQKSIKNF